MRAPILSLALAAALALGACKDPRAQLNLDKGRIYLAQNAKQVGVVTLPSGLEYRIVHSGPADGPHPKLTDEVKVHYEGKTLDGAIFDSSYQRGQPAVMTPDHVIPGWTEALQLMRPGDEWILYIPSGLAYGDKGVGPIPPNAVLVFKIELLGVLPDPGAVGRG